MANVTEQDIIDHLNEKIRFHENELTRITAVLSAFTGIPVPAKSKKVTPVSVTERKAPLPAKKKIKVENGGLKLPSEKGRNVNPGNPLTVPEVYKDSLTLNEKVAFALKEIGSGFNEDIAKAMAPYQPQSDEKRISKQISGVLSALKTSGKIKTVKEGRRDKYSLA